MEEILFSEIPTVFVASGQEESTRQAASNVTVITAQEIKERGYRDLKDVLRDVAGYDVAYDRDEWVWWSRGVTSDDQKRFLYLLDGHSVSSRGTPHFSGAMTDLPNDLSNVKQVEIIRGPGAVFWGARALGGVVNVVTKDAKDYSKGHNLGFAYGTQKSSRGDFQFPLNKDGQNGTLLSGTVHSSDGRDIYTDASNSFANFDTTSGTTGMTGSSFGPRGRYTTSLDRVYSSYRLQVKGRQDHFYYNANGFFQDLLNRQVEINKGRDYRKPRSDWFIEMAEERTFWDDLDMTLKAGAGAASESYEVISATYSTSSGLATGGQNLSSEGAGGRNYNLSLDFKKPFLDGKLDTRLGFQYERGQQYTSTVNYSSNTAIAVQTGVGIQGHGNARRQMAIEDYAAYFQTVLHPTSRLHLTAAGRWDFNDDLLPLAKYLNPANATVQAARQQKTLVFLPRVAVVWDVTDSQSLKAMFNTGFFRQQDANAVVPPEKMEQYEVAYAYAAGGSRVNLTLFEQRLFNTGVLLGGIAAPAGVASVPAGAEISRGLEFEAKKYFGKHNVWTSGSFRLKAYNVPSAANNSTNNLDALRQLPDGTKLAYPDYVVNLGGTMYVARGLFFSPSVRNVGPQYIRLSPPVDATGAVSGSATSSSSLENAVHEHAAPLFYANLNLGWEPNDTWGFFVYGNNLTNNRRGLPHAVRNGVYQPYGRYVESRVTVKF